MMRRHLSVDIPLKRVNARGVNLDLDTDPKDLYEASWLHELFSCDNSVPFHATSSNAEVLNERAMMEDQRLPFFHLATDEPPAVLESCRSPANRSMNSRSGSLASAQQSCALSKPLLKSSLLDDAESLSVDPCMKALRCFISKSMPFLNRCCTMDATLPISDAHISTDISFTFPVSS